MRTLIKDVVLIIAWLVIAVTLGVGSYKLGLSASRTGDSCLVKLEGKYMDTVYAGKYGRTDEDRQACIVRLKPRVMARNPTGV